MAQYLNKLSEQHFAIIDLCLEGHTLGDMAKITGYTVQQISNIVHSPLFQDQLSRRRIQREKMVDDAASVQRCNAMKIINDNLETAAKTQVGLMRSQDERVRQVAVTSIFDLAFSKSRVLGNKPEGGQNIQINIGNDAMERLSQVLSELAPEETGQLIDQSNQSEPQVENDAA